MLRTLSQAACFNSGRFSSKGVSRLSFTTAPKCWLKQLPPRPGPPPDSEIEEFYLKGSGPGGQKINKTNSAVQLRHTPTGIVVKCQSTRSRDQNRKAAREILAQKIDEFRNGDQARSAIVGRIKQKKSASADKKKRRKYKKLEEDRESGAEAAVEGEAESNLAQDQSEPVQESTRDRGADTPKAIP
ncbi:RF-1 domain-containing protein [Emericellopsis atlantica]|uniref:RF-1 domain-containing protein n=1 Tax=Emericellopsis atlantica TaxID=2614577 RepID=A0A9P7ZFZ4_9HYPO|nr:RF-1 domain-containing protein [Emericellopsis atlantica]KAG9250865.1 RF-1 domain-containing protein [Emericellopsis atlantica]